ncbi:thioredoxin-like protein, partial [Zopfochytrium polystomum]
GKVTLIVNVASHCGYTRQYPGLEALHRKYASRGLTVLGFPCNQFGGQEPGSAAEIAAFCAKTYAVTFPIAEKIDVNGPAAHPLFVQLKGAAGGGDVRWNFEKFLVGRDGRVVERFGSRTTPEELDEKIAALL